jgi:putative NIF3 family GTP cyclohydrolase 1 type 2
LVARTRLTVLGLLCSRWDKPAEDVTAALEARIQQANAQVDGALQVIISHNVLQPEMS